MKHLRLLETFETSFSWMLLHICVYVYRKRTALNVWCSRSHQSIHAQPDWAIRNLSYV